MKTAVVLTTINIPNLLVEYADNFKKYGHKDVEFIIVGDLKTPAEVEKISAEIRDRGFEAEYLDIPKQEKWMARFPALETIVSYNSDNRRNIGYLIALERGADIIIILDDDNYVTDGDYLAGHKIVGTRQKLKTAESSNRWFNICSMLETEPPRTIYPRGFPYSKRWKDDAHFTTSEARITINAGLWLSHPDADAVTNLNEPVKMVSLNSEQIMLAPGTFAPINTQNTAFHRDVVPCFYYVMGGQANGNKIDRYGDIWAGFFAKKVIDHMGDAVSFGHPMVDHRRNIHNLFRDLQNELWGMILTDELVPIIESIDLIESTYPDAYLELAEKLRTTIERSAEFNQPAKIYLSQVTDAMKIWVGLCRKVM